MCFLWWRKSPLKIRRRPLLFALIFALAFGFVESAVVVYLRAATGLLPGVSGTLADVQRLASDDYVQSKSLAQFPPSLLATEGFREVATIVMLVATSGLIATSAKEFSAAFLWQFAAWDLAYYAGLWLLVRWPISLKSLDVLFLIPTPWISQVWFPILVSGLTVAAVAVSREKSTPPK